MKNSKMKLISRIAERFRRNGRNARARQDMIRQDMTWDTQTLEPRLMLAGDAGAEIGLAVALRGETGTERVRVWAGDRVAGELTLSTELQNYDLGIEDSSLTGNRIRVEFLNDLYQPGAGIDRNVYVGELNLNGTIIDSNEPEIYSTGTWRPDDGIVSGSGRGSVLNANGYLQFGQSEGSRLIVYARGDEGGEQLRVQAGSEDFPVVTVSADLQAYEFLLNENVDAGSIRLSFDNDFYSPDQGIDRNLVVDRIELDGVTYQAESESVFHSGVVRDGNRQSGFFATEKLESNGYFQFNDTPPNVERYVFDTSFSGDGVVELAGRDQGFAAALADGGIVTVSQGFGFGATTTAPLLVQVFSSQGDPSADFNGGQPVNIASIVQDRFGDSVDSVFVRASDVLVDSQDRILVPVVVTTSTNSDGFSSVNWVIRLTPSGQIDASYGNAGVFEFPANTATSFSQYTIDSGDRLLVNARNVLLRVDNLGRLDTSFGVNGAQAVSPPDSNGNILKIQTREDRSIVVLWQRFGANTGPAGYLLQLNEDGSPGTWFGESGVTTIHRQQFSQDSFFSESFRKLTIDNQGRLLVTGRNSILRFDVNGNVDSSFGTDGRYIRANTFVSDGNVSEFGFESNVVVDNEDRVIVGAHGAFIRLDSSGQLDETFSGDGYAAFFAAGDLDTFDRPEIGVDSQGRLFAASRSPFGPTLGVWELV